MHITLSLAPGEQLPQDKLMEMCEHCAGKMGFENNQYIAVHHLDTNHQHIHIVANRIGFDKRTVSDSNNYQKTAKYCRKMELKYELKQVLNPRLYLSEKERLIPRQDIRKERLKENIKQSLAESKSYTDFERLMKEKKYTVIKGRGISFIDDKKVKVKGSEVGYSLQTIERILEKQRSFHIGKIFITARITIFFITCGSESFTANEMPTTAEPKRIPFPSDFSTTERNVRYIEPKQIG